MEQKDLKFQKLTPINNADISVYEEAIDFVFDNADVVNVAISGAYSAGKSSVVESYKEKHKDKKFLHISLAHFESADKRGEESLTSESVLEGKILNQLIHQIPVNKIPQTNFRVKKDIGEKDIKLMTLILCLLIGSITFLSFSEKIGEWVGNLPENGFKTIISEITGPYATIIVTLVSIICSVICIYNVVKIQKNKNLFHKVSVQGNTIEIFESQEDSYFDKYLNEVLYLFENVDADVIVFEDMDRFNTNKIFERLREVNHLTNVQRKNKLEGKKQHKFKWCKSEKLEYKPLRFFYLLRDDIFVTKDRTKFFDYIVPIVPVVDGSNSYAKFKGYLDQGNVNEKFDTVFLERLSLYIDDMRVLKNIYNELIVYMNRLNNTELNWNKMMAIIVYKNIFPRDFCNLQLGKGYVHELFNRKSEISKGEIKQLEEEKQRLNKLIDDIKNEILNDIQELDDVYNAKYKRLPADRWGTLNPEGERKKSELEKEKAQRKEYINETFLQQYQEEISAIEHKMIITKTKILSELITRDNAETIFMIDSVNPIGDTNEYKEIKGSDYFELLKFLISNGYIDETYNDYMAYFYENSISAQDKTFLRRITDKKGADYAYQLKDAQKVIISPILRVTDFYEEETLNFDLLNGILANQDVPKCQEYLKALITQINENECIDFVSKYYDSDKFESNFIIKLNEQCPQFFFYVEKNKAFSENQIRRFSIDTLCLLDENAVQNVNIENCLTNYISNQIDYLDIQKPDSKKLISQFTVLGILFKKISYENANKDLFKGVYESNLYELTYENVKLMLITQYGITNLSDIEHKNYTIIQSKPRSPLAIYIASDINTYLTGVLENCEDRIDDSEDEALDIINNKQIEDDIKEKYINLLGTSISDISKVNDTKLWEIMITREVIKKAPHNVIYYFREKSMDSILIAFINEINVSDSYSEVVGDFEENVIASFFDAVAATNEIETKIYEKILNDIGYKFDSYQADRISDEKIDVLIKNRIIEMNEDGLKFIRSNYERHILGYIDQNIDDYLNVLTSTTFSYEEAIHVLDMCIDDNKKIELLRLTKEPISVIDKKLSDNLFSYILANNFDENDAGDLYQHFSEYDESKQTAIYKVADERVDDIINDMDINLDDRLLSELLLCDSHNKSDKIQLWANAIPRLNEETCKKHFDELGFPELKGIFTKRNNFNRTYKKNSDMTAIFEALKENKWIYDYYEWGDDNERYVVIKNETKDKRH